ncbi:hypothetical protein FJ420_32610 [Mesorhizobium sp. B3-1-3]|uniref:hypothetical protein n=1 Tax=unclassified Mesorhizobium TaxID=325217 RepID=UPI00112ACF56|nr:MULTISPECIES: hypothetical protein [unclassified Mesorhizobium]TPI59211.1 hypothetical protein FJ420_32610 [Mesorhizobium sp. B3-1-3]TPI66499.1 hypothetical protein FJ424_12140 [Mesorhizobium sp. B3-1-8]
MRSNSVWASLAAAALAGFVMAIAAPAEAGLRHHDRVYADSFGNLVIDSAAGYKRIVVGEGKLAKKLSEFTSAGQPDVVYDDADEPGAPGCYQPPVLVKGRSYMYGLSDGEMPNLSPCR